MITIRKITNERAERQVNVALPESVYQRLLKAAKGSEFDTRGRGGHSLLARFLIEDGLRNLQYGGK